MLDRIREPSSPPPGVALPGAAFRDEGEDLSPEFVEEDLSASSRRNCSLFMVVTWASKTLLVDVSFSICAFLARAIRFILSVVEAGQLYCVRRENLPERCEHRLNLTLLLLNFYAEIRGLTVYIHKGPSFQPLWVLPLLHA